MHRSGEIGVQGTAVHMQDPAGELDAIPYKNKNVANRNLIRPPPPQGRVLAPAAGHSYGGEQRDGDSVLREKIDVNATRVTFMC